MAMLEKFSTAWCESVSGALLDALAEFDADESDMILAGAFAVAAEADCTAAAVLRSLADQLDSDDQRLAGGLN